jgi:hypothetical protein
VESAVCEALIRHLVGENWQGLLSFLRHEGHGEHTGPGVDSAAGVEMCVAALRLNARSRQASVIQTNSRLLWIGSDGESQTALATGFGRAIGFMIGEKWALRDPF